MRQESDHRFSTPATLAVYFAILLALSPLEAFATGSPADNANVQTECSRTTPPTCAYVGKGQTSVIVPTAFTPTRSACMQVQNNCSSDIMVPTASDAEWDTGNGDFLDHPESCVTLSACPTLAVSLKASSTSISAGSPTMLSWTVTGAIGAMTCTGTSTDNSLVWGTYNYASGAIVSGGPVSVTPSPTAPLTSTTYTLSCTDTRNTGIGTAKVDVAAAPAASCTNAAWVCPAGVYLTTVSNQANLVGNTVSLPGFATTGSWSWTQAPDGGNASYQSCAIVNNVPTIERDAHSAYDGGGWVFRNTYTLQSSFGCNFPGTWTAGSCSATCNGGVTAAPTCSTGNPADCDPNTAPVTGQSCNTQACSSACSSSSSNSYSGTCADAHGAPISGSPYGNCVVYGPNDDGCQANWNGFWIPPGPNSCYICASTYTGTWVAGSCSATACGTSGTINAPTCSTGNTADCDPNGIVPPSGQSCSPQSCSSAFSCTTYFVGGGVGTGSNLYICQKGNTVFETSRHFVPNQTNPSIQTNLGWDTVLLQNNILMNLMPTGAYLGALPTSCVQAANTTPLIVYQGYVLGNTPTFTNYQCN